MNISSAIEKKSNCLHSLDDCVKNEHQPNFSKSTSKCTLVGRTGFGMVGCTFCEHSPNYFYGGKRFPSLQTIPPTTNNFFQNPHFYHWAKSAVAKNNELRLPFGSGRIPAIAAYDVARVVAVVLANPTSHFGKSYDLTGPQVVDMNEVANAFSAALGRKISYVPLDWDEWKATTLKEHVSKDGWEQHTADHLANLAKLVQHVTTEVSPNVERLTGSPGMGFEQWVKQHANEFNETD
jgi:hypothetical protein